MKSPFILLRDFFYRYQVFRPNKQSLINNVNFSWGTPVSHPKRGAFSVRNSFQSKALRKLLKDGSSFFKISLIISSKLYEIFFFLAVDLI